MRTMRSVRKYITAAAVIAAVFVTDGWLAPQFGEGSFLISEAQARFGRPLSAASIAGVARRTTRRTVRRSAIYLGALPAGCIRATVSGAALWRCGGTYYQPQGGRYVVVYVN